MNARIFLAAAAVVLLAAGLYLLSPDPIPEPAPVVTAPATPAPPEENVTLRTNHDPQDVFQRAFWRRPTAEDRILHAERREWVSEEGGVRRWQWFLAVEPGAALDQWLREDNAFGLTKVASPASSDGFAQSPSWFPTKGQLAECEIRQAAGSKMTLIFDPAKNVLYATDAGHGFAVARTNSSRPPRGPGIGSDPKPLPFLLCQMNLLLHGRDAPQIEVVLGTGAVSPSEPPCGFARRGELERWMAGGLSGRPRGKDRRVAVAMRGGPVGRKKVVDRCRFGARKPLDDIPQVGPGGDPPGCGP